MKRAILCAALAASAFMGATTAAQAEDGQMHVKLAGLDLATADGARAALARIQSGADAFCEVSSGRQALERAAVIDRCVTQMTRKSVDQLNAPLVTALFDGHGAGQPATTVALAQK